MGCSRSAGAGVSSPSASHSQLRQGESNSFSESALQPNSFTAVVLRAWAAAWLAELQQAGSTQVGIFKSCSSLISGYLVKTNCVTNLVAGRIAEASLVPCEPAAVTDVSPTG